MSKPRLAWFGVATIVCAAILAGALLILNRRAMTIAEQTREVTRLEAENRQLRSQSDELAREIEELRRQTGMPPPVAEVPVRRAARAEIPASTLEAIRTLGQLHESLAGAKSTIEQLRDRMVQLEAEIESADKENRLLTARRVELNEELSGANRLVDALRAELKGKDKRLVPLQMANKSLRNRRRATEQKISHPCGIGAGRRSKRSRAFESGLCNWRKSIAAERRISPTSFAGTGTSPSSMAPWQPNLTGRPERPQLRGRKSRAFRTRFP
jgi:cell division protein FtsB